MHIPTNDLDVPFRPPLKPHDAPRANKARQSTLRSASHRYMHVQAPPFTQPAPRIGCKEYRTCRSHRLSRRSLCPSIPNGTNDPSVSANPSSLTWGRGREGESKGGCIGQASTNEADWIEHVKKMASIKICSRAFESLVDVSRVYLLIHRRDRESWVNRHILLQILCMLARRHELPSCERSDAIALSRSQHAERTRRNTKALDLKNKYMVSNSTDCNYVSCCFPMYTMLQYLPTSSTQPAGPPPARYG